MTQNEQILRHLKLNGSITPKEAWSKYGVYRLGARVYDLKMCGYDIRKTMIREEKPNGQSNSFAQYYLRGQGNEQARTATTGEMGS